MEQDERLVVVFAGLVADADLARSVLEGNGFDTFISNEVIGTWLRGYVACDGAVEIAVPESQAEQARALLERPEDEEGDTAE